MKTITITTEQIIEKFKKAFISISKIESKGRENGMICVIFYGTPLFFSSYYCAYDHFNRKNII